MFAVIAIVTIFVALALVKPHGPQTSVFSMWSSDREDLRNSADRPVLR